jgi:hypothetical protein
MLKTLAIAAGLTLAVSGAALAQSVYYTCSPGYAYSNGACQPVAATPGGVVGGAVGTAGSVAGGAVNAAGSIAGSTVSAVRLILTPY